MRIRAVSGLIALIALATGCASTGLVPAAYPDSTVPCPAGTGAWNLEVLDRRMRREGSEGVQSLVSESIRKSFPGCRWNAGGNDATRLVIEIHRFASTQEGNTWEAAADWSVVVTDPAGRTLTEFEANEEVSRPNYRGANNARESLHEAFDRAMRKTLAGLRSVSSGSAACLPGRTPAPDASAQKMRALLSSSWTDTTWTAGSPAELRPEMERFSQPETVEVL